LLTRVTKTILLCFEVINQKTIKIMEIYVGNLPWSFGDQELADAFKQYGTVDRASVIVERPSGRSKGFGFVTMNDHSEATAAIEALNGSDMGGRPLKVNEARPKD
jgi:RNA recognition motif-containing protein